MKRILLTGASGFLGGHVYTLLTGSHHVMALYNKNKPNIAKNDWTFLDLTDSVTVKRVVNDFIPHVIIHAAAFSNLDVCEKNPESAWKVNVKATQTLAELSASLGSRFIYVSSDMVYDGKGSFYKEDDPVSPISVYGQNKVDAENIVRDVVKNHVIARAALIYGRHIIGGNSFSEWFENKLEQKENVSLYTDQFRTPVLVNNLAEILVEMAGNDFIGTVHLGSPDRIDRYTFGKQLCRIGGYDPNLLQPCSMHDHHPAAPRPADISFSVEKAQKVFKTKLLTTGQGLERMFQ